MNVHIKKLTDYSLLQRAAQATSGTKINAPLNKWYASEHSPIRTQLFWIELENIPSFVSVHLVRHKVGVEHFVRSNRPDRGGVEKADRNTPVTHCMLVNAQALINMARKRLCRKASKETQEVMQAIVMVLADVDIELVPYLVPECFYRSKCVEFKSCGLWPMERR